MKNVEITSEKKVNRDDFLYAQTKCIGNYYCQELFPWEDNYKC